MSRNYVKTQNTWERIEYDDYQGMGYDTTYVSNKPNYNPIDKAQSVETLNLSNNIQGYTIGKEENINPENIDFNRISSSANLAANGIYTNIQSKYWGDNGNLSYKVINDQGVVAISENGTVLGYTTLSALKLDNDNTNNNVGTNHDIDELRKETQQQRKAESVNRASSANTAGIAGVSAGISGIASSAASQGQVSTGSGQESNRESKINGASAAATSFNKASNDHNTDSIRNEVREQKQQASMESETLASSSDFSFRHEQSNILAAKAKNMGFTDEQIKVAVGISRWETGNYEHLAGGYNYGGVTGVGDAGHTGQYANYSSADVGMDAYLSNLKRNYFDQGLQTPEEISRKYLGYNDNGSWTNGVKGCMS